MRKNNKSSRRFSSLRSAALSISASTLALSSIFYPMEGEAQVSSSPERFSPQALGYLQRAETMLGEQNYAGVIDQLKMLSNRNTDLSLISLLSPEAKEKYIYMLAEALYQRGDAECIEMLRAFQSAFPASPLALKARLSIADYYFFNHDWEQALEEYENIDYPRLNRTQFPVYTYRKALSLIKTDRGEQARPLLRSIAGIPEFRQPVRFYEAYLDYRDGELDKAYTGFSRVAGSIDGIDPLYYLIQIDYANSRFGEVISKAPALLSSGAPAELIPETERVLGLSYFKEGNYEMARKYLSSYASSVGSNIAPDANYALAVADYEDGDWHSAAERFSSLTSLDSSLGQSAWLYLGQCELKSGNTDAAAMAFEKAAKSDFDSNVTETALYNYAAAITRGGKIPFSSSASLLERFIKTFPNSEYLPKVEEYLATAYYNDRNYSKALKSIEAISRPSSRVMAAKQKILYELGVESVANGRAREGAGYLRQAIALSSHSKEIAAQSQLWLGDALYSLADFKGAKEAYHLAAQQMKPSANRSLALYNQAYSSYMMDNYPAAASEFLNALAASPALPSPLKDDALIRRADCLYYTGKYAQAREAYAEAIRNNAADADYASYRHAVMLGLGSDTKGKIAELDKFETSYPGSKWASSAILEKAMTYESLGQADRAAQAYREVSSKYPDGTQARKARLSLALSDLRRGRTAEAVEEYKEVIRRWPSSEEAQMANDDLKKYYASVGELSDYARFLSSVPGAAQLQPDEMEQLAFDGAEMAYVDNSANITLLRNYVRDYPDGKYLAQALLDIAWSLRNSGKYEEAEETLSHLLAARPHSPQAPEALLMKAQILEDNLNRGKDALIAYRELERRAPEDFGAEAAAGIMRASAEPSERLEYARKARLTGGLAADAVEDASLIEAEALIDLKRGAEAAPILQRLAENPASLAGAKAAVRLAEYYLSVGNYPLAEKTALAFTDAGSPHEFQLAKGFILLADAYHAQGQTRLAKEYLQSLRDNYPGKEKEISSAISSRLTSW